MCVCIVAECTARCAGREWRRRARRDADTQIACLHYTQRYTQRLGGTPSPSHTHQDEPRLGPHAVRAHDGLEGPLARHERPLGAAVPGVARAAVGRADARFSDRRDDLLDLFWGEGWIG